jgi:DNA-binding MarR family transcriptional regulator
MSDVADLKDCVARDLACVYATLQQLNLPVWLKLDISMAQLKALVAIEHTSDGVSVSGLGQRLSIGEPSASMLVDQLVKRGYASRVTDSADRRRVCVTVTDAGHGILGELRSGRRQHIDEWLARMEEADVEALARGLRTLMEAVKQESTGE